MSKEKKNSVVPRLRFPEFREAGEWVEKFLGDICQPQQWPTISSSVLVDKGYPVYGANGFIGYYPEYNHEFEAVSVTCRGSTCGEVSLIPAKCYITGNAMCLDGINTDRYSYLFLYQLLKQRGFNDIITGSALPQIVGNAIKKVRISLPNLAEQQKIAACLTTLDEFITAQGEKIKALQAHKKGLMQRLFPAEGETVPRVRFGEFEGEWEETTLKGVCQMQAGKFVSASDIFDKKTDDLFPCYGGNGLRGYTKSFTHRGSYPLIGRQGALCGNITLASGKFHATEHAVVVTTKKGIDTDWLYYLLVHLNLNQYATGQAQPGLSVDNLEKVEIKAPKGEDEQQKIATTLTTLDDLLAAQSEKLEALKRQKKGLMQQLFPSPEGASSATDGV